MSGPQFMNWYSDYFKDTLPLKMYQEYCQKYEGDGPAWTNVDLGAAEAGRNFDRLSHHQDFSEEGKCDTCGRPLCSSQEQEWGHALQRDDAFEGDKTKRFKEFKAGYLSVKHNILNMFWCAYADDPFNEDNPIYYAVLQGATVTAEQRAHIIKTIRKYNETWTEDEAEKYLNAVINDT